MCAATAQSVNVGQGSFHSSLQGICRNNFNLLKTVSSQYPISHETFMEDDLAINLVRRSAGRAHCCPFL